MLFFLSSWSAFSQCPPTAPDEWMDDSACSPRSFDLLVGNSNWISIGDSTFRWYDAPSGGNLVNVGEEYITPIISTNTTFYVSSYITSLGCESSARIPIQAKFNVFDTSVYGIGAWRVYCFDDKIWNHCLGYYNDPNANINNSLIWDHDKSPKYSGGGAAGYVGCNVPFDGHSISYKKKGFTPGIYRIDINKHDDDCQLLINGVMVYEHKGFGHGHPSVWTGPLDNNSTIEFRWEDSAGPSDGQLTLTQITPPTDLIAGAIESGETICKNGPTKTLGSSTILSPTDDAFVKSLSPSESNGTWIQLLTRSQGAGDTLEIYMSFDISNLTYPVSSAFLKIAGTNDGSLADPNVLVNVYAVPNTTWSENTITWASKPPPGQIVASTEIYDSLLIYYTWNLTNYINQELQLGKTKTSIMLKNAGPYPNSYQTMVLLFDPKEGVNGMPPMMVVNGISGGCTFKQYQWQYQNNCTGSWHDISGANSSTYNSPDTLTQNICYRFNVEDICGNIVSSNSITVTVNDPAAPSVTNSTRCGTGTVNLTASGSPDYRWYISSSGGSSIGSGSPWTTPSISSSTSYFVAGFDNGCEGAVRSQVDATVINSVAGSLSSGAASVCETANSGSITATAFTGNITEWISSTDNFTNNIVSIPSTNATIPFTNLPSTTSYKVIVINSTCPADTSAAFNMVVDPVTKGGTLALSELDKNGGVISLSGNTGSIVRWESSIDTFNTFSIINENTSNLHFNSGPVTYYRAVVQSGTCTQLFSDTIRIDQVIIYSSFSPNGDGINDVWIVDGIEQFSPVAVTIFDRWGNLVYKETDYNNRDRVWKGNAFSGFEKDGKVLPEGTYYYQIQIKNRETQSGFVVISR